MIYRDKFNFLMNPIIFGHILCYKSFFFLKKKKKVICKPRYFFFKKKNRLVEAHSPDLVELDAATVLHCS
jgi:hypothetical protein